MVENEADDERRRTHSERFSDPELVIDEVTIGARLRFYGVPFETLSRSVKMADGESHYGGACYWMEPGDGSQGAIWRSDNPLLGDYAVSIWYGHLPDRTPATDAEIRVTAKGRTTVIRLDQSRGISQWNGLGTYTDPVSVSICNRANGPIVIDAVKFERIEELG